MNLRIYLCVHIYNSSLYLYAILSYVWMGKWRREWSASVSVSVSKSCQPDDHDDDVLKNRRTQYHHRMTEWERERVRRMYLRKKEVRSDNNNTPSRFHNSELEAEMMKSSLPRDFTSNPIYLGRHHHPAIVLHTEKGTNQRRPFSFILQWIPPLLPNI